MIFGCIFVEFSLVVFKFLRNNSNSEYCKKKKPSLDKTFPNCLKKPSKKTLTRLSAKQ